MAISGSGSYIPAVRVCIRHRQLRLLGPQHNVAREALWYPEHAAARFLDCPHDCIYVPIIDEGGVRYLWQLLVEVGVLDEPWTAEQWLQHVTTKGKTMSECKCAGIMPVPPAVRQTLLRSLDTEQYEFGRHSDIDEARAWVNALAKRCEKAEESSAETEQD